MIKNVDFQETLESAFLKYAASVAQERAIPDVRDMLKIGLRQGLYAQFTNKLTHSDKFQKAQKSVAAAMAQSYVHGDVAMYDALIRSARPWSTYYPLEDVQGSYGNPSSPDSHAAARYVEMRASELADYLFNGLKKNAIKEWYWNYDDSEQIPSVFPSIGYWNIVNGCSGIAVALATSVPQFNLREVNEALIKIIRNPNISFDEIYCAPDFATGGTITNAEQVKESLKNGKGESIRLQAKLEYVPDQHMIRATQLPYGVFTNTVFDQLAALTAEDESYGIEKVIDHTKKEADIRIYLTKGANPKKMMAKLYKDTALENWYSINMILLDQGRFPKVFGWREACDAYIAHIRECKRNMIQFDLDKALARKNIVDGLIKACSIIDEVVALIRASANPSEAAEKLIDIYDFNKEQVKAILAMKLSSLTKLDIVKLNAEREELIKNIEWLQYLLNTPSALDEELITVLKEVAAKFGTDRRTIIQNSITAEEPIEIPVEEEIGIMLFDNNTIRILYKDELHGSKRGKKGVNIKPPTGASLINTLYSTTNGSIALITSTGKIYNISLNELEVNVDYSLYSLINLSSEERIILLLDSTSFTAYNSLVTVSKKGYIKKTNIKEYNIRSSKGVIATKLEDDDILVAAYLSMSDEDKVMIVSNNGNYNYYSLSEINFTGRATRGVKAIKLTPNEYIQTATIVRSNVDYIGILTISKSGKGKITPISEFTETSRGLKGSPIMILNEEESSLVYAVPESQSTMYLTTANKAVMLNTANIPVQGRMTSGVLIIDARTSKMPIQVM